MTDLGFQPHLHRPPPRVTVSVYPLKCSQHSAPHRTYEEREASKSPPNSRSPWGCGVSHAPALLKNQNKRSRPPLGSGSMRVKAVTFTLWPWGLRERVGFPECISAPPTSPPHSPLPWERQRQRNGVQPAGYSHEPQKAAALLLM